MQSGQNRQIYRIHNRSLGLGLVKRIDLGVDTVLLRRVLSQELRGRRECAETARRHYKVRMPPCDFDERLNETGERDHTSQQSQAQTDGFHTPESPGRYEDQQRERRL